MAIHLSCASVRHHRALSVDDHVLLRRMCFAKRSTSGHATHKFLPLVYVLLAALWRRMRRATETMTAVTAAHTRATAAAHTAAVELNVADAAALCHQSSWSLLLSQWHCLPECHKIRRLTSCKSAWAQRLSWCHRHNDTTTTHAHRHIYLQKHARTCPSVIST